MKLLKFKTLLLIISIVLGSSTINGQTLAGWDFSTQAGGAGNFGTSPLAATTSVANASIGSLTRGSGFGTLSGAGVVGAWGSANYTVSGTLAGEITANKFFSFTITPNAGFKVSLSGISAYNIRKSSTGPTTGQWQYQIGSGTFQNIGNAITWGSNTTATGNAQTAIDLSTIPDLQNVTSVITLRLVNYGATNVGGTCYIKDLGNTTGNDLIVNGAVSTAYVAPSISSFSPTTGATGSTVTITGSNFTGVTAVSIGGTAVTSFVVNSDTQITAVVASGSTGAISVMNSNGLTGNSSGTFTFIPAPTITSFTPTNGCTGTTVTISGTGFNGATAFSFGGTAASSFIVNSDTQISAVYGSGSTGNIAVTTPGGSVSSNSNFTEGAAITSYAYVSNQGNNSVSVINTATSTVTATVNVGNTPSGVSISPDGKKVYVSNGGSNTVSVINTATNTVTSTITVGTSPYGICVSPDGSKVYVANEMSSNVSVINTATNNVVATVAAGSHPNGISISPDGSKVYVVNWGNNNVNVINTATNTVTATITVGNGPFGVCVSPDGSKAYVTNRNSNTVSVINTATNTVTATVAVGTFPFGISVSPDCSKVYVANQSSNTVSVISTTTNTVTATVAVGTNPFGTSVSPNGTKVYVSNINSNNVSVINAGSNTVTSTVSIGTHPYSFGNMIGDVVSECIPLPTITSFTPTSGGSGTTVTITGTNLVIGGTFVNIGGASTMSNNVVNATTVTAVVGSGATGTISVTTAGGTAVSSGTFTFVPAPTISSFTPTNGSNGNTVTITGTNLTTTTAVSIGGTAASSFTVNSDTQITATVGTGATGTISVTTLGGTATGTGTFTYNIVSTAGGLAAAITAAGYNLSTMTNLTFTGTIDARDFKTMRDDMPLLAVLDMSGATISAYTGTLGTGGTSSIVYPANEIPQWAFCTTSWISKVSLTTIAMPTSITSIGDVAFSYCSALTGSLTLGSTLTSIGFGAFSGCSGFTGSLTIPNSVTIIGDHAFDSCIGLTGSLTIPNSLTTIGNNTFSSCSSLTGSLMIPNSVITIGNGAFAGCKGLTGSFIIPNGVTTIGNQTFQDCIKFTSVSIPSSVSTIGSYAFNNCTSLGVIYAHPSTPVNIASSADVFYGVNKSTCKLHVPSGSGSLYAAANQWMDFTNISEGFIAPTVTTEEVSTIAGTTATGNGTVTNLGDVNPTQYGVVWSTTTNPDISLSTKTMQGAKSATGAYTSSITGLTPNTQYYVKAYATNGAGTSYGNEVTFTTLALPTITSFTPTNGCTGTTVTITGTVFTGATAVSFGGTPATSFTVVNPTTITAVYGNGTTGKIAVTTAGGTVTSNTNFTEGSGFGTYAYIANYYSNTVSVINTATNTVTAIVAVGSYPVGVSVSPDGSKVYVANWTSNNVSVINTATNAVTATVVVGSSPRGISVSPDGSKVYVANNGSNNVSVINTATYTVTATIAVGSNPYGVSISPDGSKVYVANEAISNMSVINTTTNIVTATVAVGSTPLGVSISPDGSKVYVANYYGNTVSVINTANNVVTSTVTVGTNPLGVSVSPDGSKVFVTNGSSNNVSVINTATNSVTATIAVGSQPFGVSVSPDGSKVYVANLGSNSVSVINTAANTIISTVAVGIGPYSLGNFIANVVSPCIPAPTISSFTPTSGGTGTTITITGTNLTGTTAVSIGGTAASSVIVVDVNTVTAVVGSGTTGTISLTTPGGTAVSSGTFTFIPAPTITSFTPTTGATGATVTITGTNLTGTSAVSIGGTAASSVTVVDANTVTAVVGSGATGTISLTTPGGTAVSTDTYNFIPAPTITNFTPTNGSNGNTVVITGTNLLTTTGVSIGFTLASSFIVNSDTQLTATIGNGSTGTIGVNTLGGTAISSGIFTFTPAPTITSFSPTSGLIGSSVTITGTGFNAIAAQNIVYFGGAKAIVTSASATSLNVTVPNGSTYEPISVTSSISGLTAYSAKAFDVTFISSGIIDSNSFESKVDFAAGVQPFGIVSADLDLDGKSDLVIPNTNSSNTVSVLRNNATVGLINSSSLNSNVTFTSGNNVGSARLADIDGDGKKDIIESNYSDNTFSVLLNTSNPGSVTSSSFATRVSFSTGSYPIGIAINDIDMDGKPDVIVVNCQGDNISVFRNTSTLGNISFAPKVDFPINGQSFYVMLRDLDGDGKPEMIASVTSIGMVKIFTNTSTPGIIDASTFASPISLSTGYTPRDFDVADIDGDGKVDILVPNQDNANFSVFKNLSTAGNISFNSAVNFASVAFPLSAKVGDVDGDGKPDVVIIGSNNAQVFKNTSTSGNISFNSGVSYAVGNAPMNSAIVDINGDGKPEICVANFNDNTISILRNKISNAPTITSFTPTSGATGATITISGTNLTGTSAVSIGGTVASSVTVVDANTVTAVVGSGTTGAISLTTPGGTAVSTGTFTFIPAPTITSFTPTTGGDGCAITITGTHLTGATAVSVGGIPVYFFGNYSDTQLGANVGTGATGTVSITTPGGTVVSSGKFTFIPLPVISSFSPTSGPTGTIVTIKGKNFTGATFVGIGTSNMNLPYTVESDTIITFYSGSTSGNIRIDTPGGIGSGDIFTTLWPPTISWVTPNIGGSGTTITINGTNLIGTSSVTIGGTAVSSFTVVDNTAIIATVGNGATGTISVTTPDGTATSVDTFTYVPAPIISSFSPISGPTGTEITIKGKYLTGTTFVSFGSPDMGLPFTVISDTTITVTSGLSSGTIFLRTPGGSTIAGSMFMITYPPTITWFTPSIGGNGTTITINGTNFNGTSSVTIGGIAASSFTVVDNTTITATVANGSTGTISVTNQDGTATSGDTFTFVAAPIISSFSPTSGMTGTEITIKGKYLTGTTFVTIGNSNMSLPFTVTSDTTITVFSGNTSGNIRLTTPGGVTSIGDIFTVLNRAVINSYSPISGSAGTVITITGSNLTGTSSVTIGGIAASSFTVLNDATVTATVGNGASGSIYLTTPASTEWVGTFTYIPPVSGVTYSVTVPVGTNACYIAGTMNVWAFQAMTKVDATHYTVNIASATASDTYKYCSGPNWAYQEKDANGYNINNRTYAASDVVANWAFVYNPLVQPTDVVYNVTVPSGTNACYINGAASNWQFTAMTKLDATHYTITLNTATPDAYQYCSGPDWTYRELDANQHQIADRIYTSSDVVQNWASVFAPVYGSNYTITFSGSAAASSAGDVLVENLTQGTTVTVPAGNVLYLYDNLSTQTNQLNSDKESIVVYPNGIQGSNTLSFYSKQSGYALVNVFSIDGQKITGINQQLQEGQNSFRLSLKKGAYIVQVVGNGYSYSTKMLNLTGTEISGSMEYIGNEKPAESSPQKMKSVSGITSMLYHAYDQLLFKAVSGNFSTIITDVPYESKNINFEFIACQDADGNYYTAVTIGTQTWMAENLRTTKYRTGETVPNVTDATVWSKLFTGAWCDNANNPLIGVRFGHLYNYASVADPRNIAPVGWHVATDAEWTTLSTYLGGGNVAGGKLKETGTVDWLSPNAGATNQSGFNALAGGGRSYDGTFGPAGYGGGWWSSTPVDITTAWGWKVVYNDATVAKYPTPMSIGGSVRCVKDVNMQITIPVLTTLDVTLQGSNTASGGGNISSDGGASVLVRGLCWGTTPTPTIGGFGTFTTSDGSGAGSFSSSLSALNLNQNYYVRAYATNSVGTAYGNEVMFMAQAIPPSQPITNAISAITSSTASGGGSFTMNGNIVSIMGQGICWSTSPNPTITDSKTSDVASSGTFTSSMTGLTAGTTYYVRAYISSYVTWTGTSGSWNPITYGNEVSFTVAASQPANTVTDIDGNVYHTVIIGTQTWMVENLKTTKYRNGDAIPSPVGDWSALTSGAQAAYNNDAANATKFGLLYNWYAVADTRNITPTGWHVPTDVEWTTLTTYLGGEVVAGGKLKEIGTLNWTFPNTGATNETGFYALPGGDRFYDGTFFGIGYYGYWWSASESSTSYAWINAMYANYSFASKSSNVKQIGYSVRCIKD